MPRDKQPHPIHGLWPAYATREETRREHLLELRTYLGLESFDLAHYRQAVHSTTELAMQSDEGIVPAGVVDALRCRHVVMPSLDVIERICAEAITRANRNLYAAFTHSLSAAHRHQLDGLLKRMEEGKSTVELGWHL
ncbi:hypothetical protein GCM10009582_09570 [Arthrobacter flavus]